MIELRWIEADEPRELVLQYRYLKRRHPGFVQQAGPNTGEDVQPGDVWSEWKTVQVQSP